METIIITTKEELQRVIREVVREEIAESANRQALLICPAEDVFLSRGELARLLGISLPTLADWVRRGLPGHQKRRRGRVVFIKSEVMDWLRSRPELKYSRKRP